jgi:dihydrolipoamide dehydrogenase
MVFDIVVIGGGPGGYVAAIRAAQLGGKVALVEKKWLGGVCTNVGCIPSKALLWAADLKAMIKGAAPFGIEDQNADVKFEQLVAHKEKTVKRLSAGIEFLLSKNGVEIVRGTGSLVSRDRVRVENNGQSNILEAKNVIVATGSSPARPDIDGINNQAVITGEETTELQELPRSVVIAGGGAEGAEFAYLLASLGVEVKIIEMLPRFLPLEDHEIGSRLQRSLSQLGIDIRLSTKLVKVESEGATVKVHGGSEKGTEIFEAERLILALGRRPNSASLGLEELGVRMVKGWIVVNEQMKTDIPGIYAIGDVVGGGFAHQAMIAGEMAAENIIRGNSKIRISAIPRVIFTIPEIAAVGYTEEQARKSAEITVGRFLFNANGRALATGQTEGMVKIIAEKNSGKILGVHIIGHNVSEIIGMASLAMHLELTLEELTAAIIPHPTLSEALREAALDAMGAAIHKVRI